MAKRHRTSAERRDEIRANTEHVKATCALSAWEGDLDACRWCNNPLGPRRRTWCTNTCRNAFERNHLWSRARSLIKRRARGRCAHCHETVDRIEINHIVPVVGQGYGLSCSHHLENLEPLCHGCHVRETNAQRRERARNQDDT